MVGEGLPQARALVVVARQEVERRAQRREQVAQLRILGGAPEVGEVAGDDDRLRRLRQGKHGAHRTVQEGGAVDLAVGQPAGHADVGVAQLDQELRHGSMGRGGNKMMRLHAQRHGVAFAPGRIADRIDDQVALVSSRDM